MAKKKKKLKKTKKKKAKKTPNQFGQLRREQNEPSI